jgi:ABC-2 type transport system ATP-binding protein
LLGLHRPSSGLAELLGFDAWRDPVTAHRQVAYVAGEPFLWPALTGTETLEFLARVRGGTDAAYCEQLIERFQLEVSKRVRALSKGNRQKVQLVAAFASRAKLLILDEPTSGLDPLMEAAFRETVREAKERGQTIFLSSHILSEVEALCDRIGILRAGRLVDEGTLASLRHLSASTLEVTFAGPPPTLPTLPGITVASAGANALRCEVSGSVGPLIAALAKYPVVALTSREPSLEEIFLHHYETSDGRSVTDAPRSPSVRDGGTEQTQRSSDSATGQQGRHDSASERQR